MDTNQHHGAIRSLDVPQIGGETLELTTAVRRPHLWSGHYDQEPVVPRWFEELGEQDGFLHLVVGASSPGVETDPGDWDGYVVLEEPVLQHQPHLPVQPPVLHRQVTGDWGFGQLNGWAGSWTGLDDVDLLRLWHVMGADVHRWRRLATTDQLGTVPSGLLAELRYTVDIDDAGVQVATVAWCAERPALVNLGHAFACFDIEEEDPQPGLYTSGAPTGPLPDWVVRSNNSGPRAAPNRVTRMRARMVRDYGRVYVDEQVPETRAEGVREQPLNGNNGAATNTDDMSETGFTPLPLSRTASPYTQSQGGGSAEGNHGPTASQPLRIVNPAPRSLGSKRSSVDPRKKPAKGSKNPKKNAGGIGAGEEQAGRVGEGDDEVPICRHYREGSCTSRRCRFAHPEDEAAGWRAPIPPPVSDDYAIIPLADEQGSILVHAVDATEGGLVYYHAGPVEKCQFGRLTKRTLTRPMCGIPVQYTECRMHDGAVMWAVAHGTRLQRVVESRFGTVVVGRDGTRIAYATYCSTTVPVPRISTGLLRQDEESMPIHNHALKCLNRLFSSGKQSPRDVDAAAAYVLKNWDTRDDEVRRLLLGTVDYFFAMQYAKTQGMRVLRNGLLAPQGETIDVRNDVLDVYVRVGNLNPGPPWYDYGMASVVPLYEVRPDARIGQVRGCDAAPEVVAALRAAGVPAGNGGLPVFTTVGEAHTRFGVKRWWQFLGTGESFQRPLNDTQELYVALKRIVGVRDDEERLVMGEWNFMAASRAVSGIYRASFGLLKLRHAKTAPWVSQQSKDLATVYGGTLYLPSNYATEVVVAKQMDAMIRSDITRAALRQLIDGCSTAVNYVAGHCTLAKYTTQEWIYSALAWAHETEESTRAHRERMAAVPHVKRSLKMSYVRGVKISTTDELLVRNPEVKLKNETKKPGKAARVFVALGAGSEAAGLLPVILKAAIDGVRTYDIGGVELITQTVMKPDRGILRDVFKNAILAREVPGRLFVAHHSDDMLVSGCVGGVPMTFKLDISSCDTSNRAAMFTWLHCAAAQLAPGLATALIKQCQLPLLVRNPLNPRSEWWQVYPAGIDGVFQGSGWVGTTVINTFATKAIAFAIAHRLSRGDLYPDMAHDIAMRERAIQDGARQIGYAVTVEACERDGLFVPELMDFLKHAYDPENDCVFLCPGAILRNFGSMDGVIAPARLGWTSQEFAAATEAEIIHRLASGVVNGLKYEPSSVVMDALRARFADTAAPVPEGGYARTLLEESYAGVEPTIRQDCSINRALLARYDVTPEELQLVGEQLTAIQVGQRVRSYAVGQMFAVDYGLANGPREMGDVVTRIMDTRSTPVGEVVPAVATEPLV